MHDRPRILLIAEAANPQWVSVPLVGFSHSRALREVADVHLVTHVRNRAALLDDGLREGDDFTAIDSERVARPLYRLASALRGGAGRGWTCVTALQSLAYYYFEHLVWRRFAGDIRARRFDAVHRLTPLTPTAPSLIARHCRTAGVPFVLGPLNGGLPWPKQYRAAMWREREWLSPLRAAHRLLPGYRATRRHAAAILIGSGATWNQLPRRYHHKAIYIPENGIDPQRFVRRRQAPPTQPIRVAFVGRLVPYKNPDVVIDAAASLARSGDVTLDLFGDGPMRDQLKRQITSHQVGEHIRLHGWIAHEQLQSRLCECDALVLPSIREFGGGVVLEAMALGVVPIVVDYGGPGELVDDACGYRLPLTGRAELVARLGAILRQLAAAPHRLLTMRDEAARRVEERFTWRAKARQTRQVYDWVLGRRSQKPDFARPWEARAAIGSPRQAPRRPPEPLASGPPPSDTDLMATSR